MAKSYWQTFKEQIGKANIPAQVGAVLGFNPQQAQSYRQEVDRTVPRIPVKPPPPILPTAQPGTAYFNAINTAAQAQPWAETTVDRTVNFLPNAVAGAAKLPAARTIPEGVGDIADIAQGALMGAGLFHAGVAGARGITNTNPTILANQRGGLNLKYKYSPEGNLQTVKPTGTTGQIRPQVPQGTPEQMIEKARGWKPGMRVQFDTAMFNRDIPTILKLLPQVPNEYKMRFGNEIMNILGVLR